MGTPTYQPIANITLGSTTASVTFSGITQQYRDLVLVCSIRSTRADSVDYLSERLNGDTNPTYSHVAGWGDQNNSVQTGTGAGEYLYGPNVAGSTTTAGTFTSVTYQFMDYSVTDKHKTILIRQGGLLLAGGQTEMDAARWANNAPISSILINLPYVGGSFAAGSTFALYGVAA